MLGLGKKSDGKDSGESKNWYKDRFQYVLVQRNLLALITVVSLIGALFSSIAVSQLTPHKSVQPFVIQIDDTTGETRIVKSQADRSMGEQEAIDKSNVAQFVQAWESYDPAFREHYNHVINANSYDTVYRQYYREQNPRVEGSTAARLGSIGKRSVKIRSILFLDPHRGARGIENYVAQIRLMVTETMPNQPPKSYNIVALIAYTYLKNQTRTMDQIYLNPLGFYVVSYKVEEDVS